MWKWDVKKPDSAIVNELVKCGLPELCANVLCARNIDSCEKADEFFNSINEDTLTSPFSLKGMNEAVEIINDAIDNNLKICIYGDYDCDGITSTVLLYTYLECSGANVSYYINARSEGYGMNCDAIKYLKNEGTDLIITVDNGIASVEEAKLVKELGMKLVITDHHQPPEILPVADAVINPNQPGCMSLFKKLCGCGVAFKLIAALDGGDYSMALEQFSDIVAIATVADVVPVVGENRAIVYSGLRHIKNTDNIGLKALIDIMNCGKDKEARINTDTIAFQIAPRINSTGRFATADIGVKLLLCEDEDNAKELAEKIEGLNNQRKKVETDIEADISEYVNNNPSMLYNRVLIFKGDGWHHGILGIVASHLVSRFGKPVFIMSDEGDKYSGSARNVDGFSIYNALNACSESLEKFGGHVGAGGFTMKKENFDLFCNLLNRYAKDEYPEMPVYSITAVKIITAEELTEEQIKSLDMLEPYGESNKKPLFVFSKTVIKDIRKLSGKNKSVHTKVLLTYCGKPLQMMLWNTDTNDFQFKVGDIINIIGSLETNTYNNETYIVVRPVDFMKSGINQQQYIEAKKVYEKYKRGEGIDKRLVDKVMPSKEELNLLYQFLDDDFEIFDNIYFSMCDKNINYCKFCFILDVLEEFELIERDYYNSLVKKKAFKGKLDLESSVVLKKLNSFK